jgi:ubiquinol-cytochrome c reductase cytochrome c subunit
MIGSARVPWLAGTALVALAVTITVLHGPGTASAQPVPQAPPADPHQIYLRDCATCHGADGGGTNRGPTLVGVGPASIDYYLSSGRMPLVEGPGRDPETRQLQPLPIDQLGNPDVVPKRHHPAYPPAVVRQLVDYVAGITGGGIDIPRVDASRGDVPQGGEIFRLQCAACHAWAGDGGALLHREAPSLHLATPTQIGEVVRVGPGVMPAFGVAAIPDDQLNSLVAYVRYLDDPRNQGGQPLWHLGPVAEGGMAWIVGMGLVFLALRWIGERS